LLYERLPNTTELDEFFKLIAKQRKIPDALKHVLELIPKTAHPMDIMRCVSSFLGTIEPEMLDDKKGGKYYGP